MGLCECSAMCYTYPVEENAMNQNEIRGNLDTGLLKIIALVCMIIDHAGVRLLGNACLLYTSRCV